MTSKYFQKNNWKNLEVLEAKKSEIKYQFLNIQR